MGFGVPLPPFGRHRKVNFVDHHLSDQTSVLKFVEDNWNTGRIGGGSMDKQAGSLESMFNFSKAKADRVILDPTSGAVVTSSHK